MYYLYAHTYSTIYLGLIPVLNIFDIKIFSSESDSRICYLINTNNYVQGGGLMDGGFGVGLHPHHHHLNGGGGGARKYHCKMCPQVINNINIVNIKLTGLR